MSAPGRVARLFVGLAVPRATAEELVRAFASFEVVHAGWRCVPAEDLHVTLVFLGDVALDASGPGLGELTAALERHAASVAPTRVQLEHFGAFPSAAPGHAARVLWAGPRRPAPELQALHRASQAACAELGLVREPVAELAAWSPHVTLARAPRGRKARVPDGLDAHPLALEFEAREFVLFETVSPVSGAGRYRPIQRVPLNGTPA